MYSKMFKDSTVPRLHLAWLSCCSPHVFTDRSIIDLSIQGFGASVQSRWQQLPPVPAGELQGQGLNATDDPWTKHFFCVKHGDFPQKNGVLDIVVWKMFSPEMLGRWSRNPYQSPSAMCFLFLTQHSLWSHFFFANQSEAPKFLGTPGLFFAHYGSTCSNIFLE